MGLFGFFKKNKLADKKATFDFILGIYDGLYKQANKNTKIDSISLLLTLVNVIESDGKKFNPIFSDSIKEFADYLDNNDNDFYSYCDKHFKYAKEYALKQDELSYQNFVDNKHVTLNFMKQHGLDLT
jgi:hypothetical protein